MTPAQTDEAAATNAAPLRWCARSCCHGLARSPTRPCRTSAWLTSPVICARGHVVAFLDGIAEGLNQAHALPELPGFQIQGITREELVGRLPADTRVVGFSSMFSVAWVLLRRLIEFVRARFPLALLVGGGEHFTALPVAPPLAPTAAVTTLAACRGYAPSTSCRGRGGQSLISRNSGPPASPAASAPNATSRCSRHAVALRRTFYPSPQQQLQP